MINVTKVWLPNKKKYISYIDKIYSSGWLTNGGPLLRELEEKLADYLGVKHIILVSNGTAALQISYKILDLNGSAITTPFSFVATTNSLISNCIMPSFADIDPNTLNIDPEKVEGRITEDTEAIVAVHVFGNPCDIERLEDIGKKYNLRVIYDAAHAFGSEYKNETVLKYGDISTLSFHATKLFHTIEGGAICLNDEDQVQKARELINFGIAEDGTVRKAGINAKMNEFEAAMGLCLLDDLPHIFEKREEVYKRYIDSLSGYVKLQSFNPYGKQNYSYFPVLFKNEEKTKHVLNALKQKKVHPRRYFYPSLDTLPYLQKEQVCPVSREIASKILCLPLYPDLGTKEQDIIIDTIKKAID